MFYLKTIDLSISITSFKVGYTSAVYYPRYRKNEKWNTLWTIQISGTKNLIKYINIFGFTNQKHITKIEIWKKYGFCPPYTTLHERKQILKGKLDPYGFY